MTVVIYRNVCVVSRSVCHIELYVSYIEVYRSIGDSCCIDVYITVVLHRSMCDSCITQMFM